jgi:4-hydroxybenzoate polyprenyltransferase
MENADVFFPVYKYLQLARVQDLIVIFIIELTFSLKTGGNYDDFMFLISSHMMLFQSGNVINNIIDIETDKINKKDVIVGKYFDMDFCIILYIISSIVGVVIGFFYDVLIPHIAIFMMLSLHKYTSKIVFMKNITKSLAPLISIACCFNITKTFRIDLIGWAYLFFLINLQNEMVKDCCDMIGDTKVKRKTVPIVFGTKYTKSILYGLSITILMLYIALFVHYFTIPLLFVTLFAITLTSCCTIPISFLELKHSNQKYIQYDNFKSVVLPKYLLMMIKVNLSLGIIGLLISA